MATDIKPVHLLLLEPSSNDAETMITTLRNHGYPVRATQVIKEDDLIEQLSRQTWDLCLTRAEVKGLNANRVVELIDEYARDIPVILITHDENETDLISALRSGMKDAVPFASQELMYLIVKRELENLEQRKLRKKAELLLAEAEKRCNLLLDSSQDAIAYIHDGMHIYANQAYVELFGFEDPDELLCMPVMDMIAGKDHENFKNFLRQYAKNPSHNQFAANGINGSGEEFESVITLSNATYDNESCTQFLVKSRSDNAELEAKVAELSAQDVLTGLYNQNYFQERLDDIINADAEAGNGGQLLFIALDQYKEISKDFGIGGADDIITAAAHWIEDFFGEEPLLARYGNENFVVYLESFSPDKAKQSAEELLASVAKHLFEIEGKTQKITISIGIAPVGDQTNNAREIISFAHSACMRAVKAGGNNAKVTSKMVDGEKHEHSDTIAKIHDAIETGKFHLLFQPIVKLHGEEKPMYQALLRMKTDKGDIPPSEIFPIAQIGGLAAKLDRWVLMESLKQLHHQKSKASIFVHLSAQALTDDTFLTFIDGLFKSTKMPQSSLVLGVNAEDAMTYLKKVIVFSQMLKKMKVNLAITHLTPSPEHLGLLDQIIPKYAITDADITTQLSSGGESIAQITTIFSEAHQRDVLTITPKVEDAATLAALWPLGVKYIQGFYLQMPLPTLNFDFSSSEF